MTRTAGGSGHREAIQRLARSRIAVHAARGHLVYGERARKRSVATRDDLTLQEAQIARLARDALTRDRVRRWAVSGRRLPTALARLTSEADCYRLENAVQLRHFTASIVVLAPTAGAVAGREGSNGDSNAARSGGSAAPAASNGPSLTISNFAFKAASITGHRGACTTDNARAAGRPIA